MRRGHPFLWPKKEARTMPGLSQLSVEKGLLRRLLEKHSFNALHSGWFVGLLDGRDFARRAGEGGFVKLTLGVGLLRLAGRAVQVANDFRDRDQVTRIDLRFVFLRAARPHRTLDARAALERVQRVGNDVRRRQLAHAHGLRL